MPSECVFEFDRPVPIYYSGETINGRISLTTTSAKSVNVVYILFEGQGKVHWEKRRSSGKNSYTEHFRSFESYFNSRTNVFGEGELPPGTHTYTFCIPLPLECPTSCVERYGKISYEVSLVVDRPWRFNNVFKRPITVLQTYNLNMYADLLLPLKNEDVKYLCCWPCSAGPIISTLTIPFGGYAPGQKINYTLCIDNQSNGNDLEGIKITLLQKYIFRATSPRQKFKEHINALATESQDQRVLRLSKREINASLLIPPVPPSSRSNGIINIYYSILMAIRTGACHKASEIEIPITIGTIPLAQSAVNPATAAQWIPQTPDTPAGAAADLPPSYDNCRPPSFETSTHIGEKFIDTEVNEHHRTDDFIPHYPMYTNFSAPSAPPPETSDAPLLQQPHNPSANTQFN
ncbi:arrestin domain-containing protein 3-like [Drosophila sulfurigaster albostrigata]|uniref:arrestin domain-containing protein 3-like n=1 Tax=Drosophila sulfurigaster albostrigata TaxID=89887 RepID=UPI002D21BAC2|nr:arrestin domain-containing protein 3-like [Drosophila sulfurigaster albostrigata]